jgi:hypothetical protein
MVSCLKKFIFLFFLLCSLGIISTKNLQAQQLIYPPESNWYQISAPSISRPDYLNPIIDPVFGTQITRITDQSAFGVSNLRHHYSKDQPWNSDGSLIKIKQWLLDGNNYQIIKKCNLLSGEVRWSHKNPKIAFARKGTSFVKINVDTCQETTLRKFSECSSLYLGPWEGNISIDDKYAAFQCNNSFIVYNIETNNIEAQMSFSGSLDWVSMSQSGNYVVANWNSNGTGRYQGVEAYDRNLNFLRQIATTGEHGDLCYDTNGDEVYVHVIPFQMIRLRDGQKTQLLSNLNKFSGHISCRNYKRPGWAYVTMNNTSYGDIFAIKLDGSGTVNRFTHHRSLDTGYESEPHGVAHPLGTKVMFASNWNGISDINSYVTEMPQNYPPQPTQTPTKTPTSTPYPTNTPIPGHVVIIDNDDGSPSYTESGSQSWFNSSYPNPYGASSRANYCSPSGDTASWTTVVNQTGSWQVSAWWTSGVGRITDAKYQVFRNGTLLGTSTVDQSTNGGQFNHLATYSFTQGDTVRITLLDQSDNCGTPNTANHDTVSSDAVRLVYSSSSPTSTPIPICFGTDSTINADDVSNWSTNYLSSNNRISVNNDNLINTFEFGYLVKYWNQTCNP